MSVRTRRGLVPLLLVLLGCAVLCLTATLETAAPGKARPMFLPLYEARLKNTSAVVRHNLQRHPLRRGLADARMWLYGHVLTEGYYYTMLGLGTPPQEFALIVDTGSTVTYVPCKTCTHCGDHHQDNPYVPSSSSSFQAVQCQAAECPGRQCGADHQCVYSRHYAEDSTSSGIIASDLASFGSTSSIPPTRILFGCETSETGDLYTQRADGIIGMGKGTLSIMNQLVGSKATEDQFSLCYGGMERGGGSMILGAVPPPPGMQFVPLDQGGGGTYYNVAIDALMVGNTKLKLASSMFNEGYGSVLDSGTTFSYLPTAAFLSVKASILAEVQSIGLTQVAGPDPHYEDVCFGPASDDPRKLGQYFPTITFVFRPSVSYQLQPENFLFRHTSDSTAYCLGLFANRDRGTLLGGILVRNTMVTYDRVKKRVGFWKTNCSDLFETLTALEGPQAPPLPQALTDEPPSDVPPAVDSQGVDVQTATSSPDVAPADSACSGCAAQLQIAFRLSVSSSSFGDLKDFFVSDIARELSVDTQQILDVEHEAPESDGSSNEDTACIVHFVVNPPSEYELLTADTVKRIQTVLQNTAFSLRDAFGAVTLTSFVVVPPKTPTYNPWYWYLVGFAILLLATLLIAVIVWRQRTKQTRLEPIDDERREEKTALADTNDSHEIQLHAEDHRPEQLSNGAMEFEMKQQEKETQAPASSPSVVLYSGLP